MPHHLSDKHRLVNRAYIKTRLDTSWKIALFLSRQIVKTVSGAKEHSFVYFRTPSGQCTAEWAVCTPSTHFVIQRGSLPECGNIQSDLRVTIRSMCCLEVFVCVRNTGFKFTYPRSFLEVFSNLRFKLEPFMFSKLKSLVKAGGYSLFQSICEVGKVCLFVVDVFKPPSHYSTLSSTVPCPMTCLTESFCSDWSPQKQNRP